MPLKFLASVKIRLLFGGYNQRDVRQLTTLCALTALFLSSQLQAFQTAARKPRSAPVAKPAPEPPMPPVPLPSEPGEYAIFYTSKGNIVCRLFDADAPKTVANFVGLANGTKAWTNPKTGKRMHTALYSGTIFHRVIPGFMIQGGDPEGTGNGEPGYKFDDEIAPNHHFDKPGILAMANSGPNTNGSQFFITVGPAEHLEGKYNVFGEVVSGQEIADAIANVPRNSEDRPDTPVTLTRVVIKTVTAAPATAPPA